MTVERVQRVGRRRAQLNRESILEATRGIAAEGGQITFRALGSALDADHTAVYRHFRDKEELVRATFDQLLSEVCEGVDQTLPWRDQAYALARLTWEACASHPSIGVEAHTLTTGGPGEMCCVEILLALLTKAGLPASEAVHFYAVLSNYTLGVASTKAAHRLADPGGSSDVTATWLGDLAPIDPGVHPHVARVRAELSSLRDDDVYAMGLDVILDAAERTAERGSAEHP
ncbi:TetR/AcrR family transcriptional regulator [Monashia sp. NPDC004114]